MSDVIGRAGDGRDPDACTCSCHRVDGMHHIAPCCTTCDDCGVRIRLSAYPAHRDRHGIIMEGVTEYGEGFPVRLVRSGNDVVVEAKNEAGYNATQVDLMQLLNWIKINRPELLK